MKIKYPKNFSPSRNKVIIEYCKGKNVLHVGACDAPYTKEKYNGSMGPLLYREIDKVCSKQLGIDLDKDSIDFLNSKNDFQNSEVKFFDMNKLEYLDFKPDVIVFGEVIEHLMNLEIALTNLKKVMDKDTLLIISTPNCFHIGYIINAFFGFEYLHEDHKVFFSYGYLKNLLKFNDIIEEKFYFTNLDSFQKKSFFGKIAFYVSKISIYFSDTLLFIGKKCNKNL